MIFSSLGGQVCPPILIVVGRDCKLTKMDPLSENKAEPVLHDSCDWMQDLGVPFLSITFDNRKEFASYQSLSHSFLPPVTLLGLPIFGTKESIRIQMAEFAKTSPKNLP